MRKLLPPPLAGTAQLHYETVSDLHMKVALFVLFKLLVTILKLVSRFANINEYPPGLKVFIYLSFVLLVMSRQLQVE